VRPLADYCRPGVRPLGSWSVLLQEHTVWIEGPRIGGNGVFPNEGIVCLIDGTCTEGDVKLIAAAPDLLAALIEAHSWLTEYSIGSAPVLKLIQSAIDKTTGVPHA
jgi:hypothetical protein